MRGGCLLLVKSGNFSLQPTTAVSCVEVLLGMGIFMRTMLSHMQLAVGPNSTTVRYCVPSVMRGFTDVEQVVSVAAFVEFEAA